MNMVHFGKDYPLETRLYKFCFDRASISFMMFIILNKFWLLCRYVACSLISIVVGRVKVEVNGKDRDPKVNLIDSFIKVFISLVRTGIQVF
jgi:hypothetical protein